MNTDPSEMPQTKLSPNDKSIHESDVDDKVVELVRDCFFLNIMIKFSESQARLMDYFLNDQKI